MRYSAKTMASWSEQLKLDLIVKTLKEKGVYNPSFNIVGLRGVWFSKGKFQVTKNALNFFNDCIILIKEIAGVPTVINAFAATVDPGSYYDNYPLNEDGCARLELGCYKNVYTIGPHGSDPRFIHRALRQSGNLTIRRDRGQDGSWKGDPVSTDDDMYINIHGQPWMAGRENENDIGRSSAACQVIYLWSAFKEFMSEIDDSGLDRFSYSLFNGYAALASQQDTGLLSDR